MCHLKHPEAVVFCIIPNNFLKGFIFRKASCSRNCSNNKIFYAFENPLSTALMAFPYSR